MLENQIRICPECGSVIKFSMSYDSGLPQISWICPNCKSDDRLIAEYRNIRYNTTSTCASEINNWYEGYRT